MFGVVVMSLSFEQDFRLLFDALRLVEWILLMNIQFRIDHPG
jgi:hypothetical protein